MHNVPLSSKAKYWLGYLTFGLVSSLTTHSLLSQG